MIDGGTTGLFAGMKPDVAGAGCSTDELPAEVLALVDLSSYNKSSDIQDPSSRRDVDKSTSKLKAGELRNYVTQNELAAFDCLPCTGLEDAIAAELTLPDNLAYRLLEMERGVSEPGGALPGWRRT